MKEIQWSEEKNAWLKQNRGIGFEDIATAIIQNGILATINHPNRRKYPNQKIFLVERGCYAYLVPFVEDKQKIFLKTIFPSRKATRDYIIRKNNPYES